MAGRSSDSNEKENGMPGVLPLRCRGFNSGEEGSASVPAPSGAGEASRCLLWREGGGFARIESIMGPVRA